MYRLDNCSTKHHSGTSHNGICKWWHLITTFEINVTVATIGLRTLCLDPFSAWINATVIFPIYALKYDHPVKFTQWYRHVEVVIFSKDFFDMYGCLPFLWNSLEYVQISMNITPRRRKRDFDRLPPATGGYFCQMHSFYLAHLSSFRCAIAIKS